uniref:Uncharacterized protein n=1 Tax=Sphaerodactylus townsendi TaxID=933632 RepID=A0ACB8FZD0_9SAUR
MLALIFPLPVSYHSSALNWYLNQGEILVRDNEMQIHLNSPRWFQEDEATMASPADWLGVTSGRRALASAAQTAPTPFKPGTGHVCALLRPATKIVVLGDAAEASPGLPLMSAIGKKGSKSPAASAAPLISHLCHVLRARSIAGDADAALSYDEEFRKSASYSPNARWDAVYNPAWTYSVQPFSRPQQASFKKKASPRGDSRVSALSPFMAPGPLQAPTTGGRVDWATPQQAAPIE